MRLRLIHVLSLLLLFVLFSISVVLVYLAIGNLAFALIFGFVNIIGATFPPTRSLIDAKNPLLFSALAIGLVGNVALTILFTSLFYQFLSKRSISEWIAKQKIRRMKEHVIITPINGISLDLAKKLKSNGISYVLLDIDRHKVRAAIRSGLLAMAGDATNAAVLHDAEIENAFVLFSLYEEDITNTFIAIAAKSINERCSVISRIKRIEDIPKIERAGARRVILPEAAIGEEMANFIISKY